MGVLFIFDEKLHKVIVLLRRCIKKRGQILIVIPHFDPNFDRKLHIHSPLLTDFYIYPDFDQNLHI